MHDPDSPYAGQYDSEVLLTLSDWYHDQMPGLIADFISVANPTGAEPVPDSSLMNDGQNQTFPIEAGKTYFYRLINIGAFAGQYFWIEGHNFTIIEVDGVYTQPQEVSMIYVTAAQRYGVLLTARNDTSANFAINSAMDTDLFDTIPDGLQTNTTSHLVYDASLPLPEMTMIDEFDAYDDFGLVPQDQMPLLDQVDHQIILTMKMDNLGDGANYAFFNDTTYVSPKVPTLYTVLSTGNMATNPDVYAVNTNAFVLGYNEVVEIVMNNDDAGKHPFHLHGHEFQAVWRSDEDAGYFDPNNVTYSATPMRRDTFMVRPQGNFAIRFRSTNPGVWLFHCHL